MSSSFRLQKRKEEKKLWEFGPYYDHYIRDIGNCHPDYEAHPIGHADGAKVCVRRPKEKIDFLEYLQQFPQGYNRFCANLYDPRKKVADQISDNWEYRWRRMPNEAYALQHDLYRIPIKYDSTGTEALYQTDRNGYPYYLYGVDTLNKPKENYDVTRLHQLSSTWKFDESRFPGGSPKS